MVQTTYSNARAHLAELCDRVTTDHETVIITRHGAPRVALVAADELASLEETAHLLRSPANAKRLLTALDRALARTEQPDTLADLRADLNFAEE